MNPSFLYIKNMVCNRCIKVVRDELMKLNAPLVKVELGKVQFSQGISLNQKQEIRMILEENGFELIDDKKSQLIDRVKTIIIQKVHHNDDPLIPQAISKTIGNELPYDYSYLSHLFSSVEGITIEKYIIKQKIEKVKEFLVYDELSLKEISYQLGYSSIQHLSNQFKKITGLSPSHFKKLKKHKRKPLDEV